MKKTEKKGAGIRKKEWKVSAPLSHALTAAVVSVSLLPSLPSFSLSSLPLSSAAAIACTAVTAAVHTMSSTLAPLLRSLTGAVKPWSTGPTAAAPVACCTAL